MQLIIAVTVQFILHIFYLVPMFRKPTSVDFSYGNFAGSFRKVFNRTRQTSPLLHLNDFKTKSKFKWIFQSKERHKTVNRSWHYWNNLNNSSVLLILEIGFLTSKSCNTLWKKSMYEHMWLIFCGTHMQWLFCFLLEHRKGNPRVLGSSPTWGWLYIWNRKNLAQHEYHIYHLIPHHILINYKENGKWSDRRRQNAEIEITLCEGGNRWEI